MHYRDLGYGAAALLCTLSSCASPQYRNVNHPNYGDVEYQTDLTPFRKENSTTTTSEGLYTQIHVEVDEAKTASRMTSQGWQPVNK